MVFAFLVLRGNAHGGIQMAERKEIDEIKTKCTAEDVARYCGKEPKSGFITLRGEKTPSVKLYSDHYHDYGDQSHGDVISLWMRITGDNFRTALKKMGDWLGVPIDTDTLQEWTRETETRKDRIQTTQRKAAQECRMLAEKNEGLSRDIADKEASEGYAQTAAIFRRQSEVELTGDLMEDEHNAELMISTIRLFGGEGGRSDADILENELFGNRSIEADKPKKKKSFFVDLSKISDEDKTQFIWFPYLPTGEVTLLTADTKVGKGMLCALLAARLSSGLGLSDTEYVRCPEGKRAFPDDTPVGTIFLTREDGAKDIKPRFISSGGNENFLNVVDDTVQDEDGIPFTKKLNLATNSGLTLLSDMIDAVNAKLIIIDPLADFSGGKNLNNREEVRELINGIRTEIARKKGVAVVIVHHTKKRGRGDSDYADMISGSHAFREVVRSVVAVEYDPEDPKAADNPKNTNWRIVMHLEGNRAIIGRTVRFYIGPDQEAVKNKINRVGGHFPVKGDDFEIWSDVTPDIYKIAGLRGVSPGTIVRERREKQRIQDSTLDPLKQSVFKLAKTMKEKGLSFAKKSYSEFEEENGGSAVWCGRTQNKALELLSGVFTANGISIKPGVKTDRGNERGFSISLSAEKVS